MKFYIIFQPADSPRWWMRFLDKTMQHCWIAKEIPLETGDKIYLSLENLYGYASMDLVFVSIGDIADLIHGAVIVEYEVEIDPDKRDWIPEPVTCVTLLKKVLGIHKVFLQTPRQLYKYLLAKGGNTWEQCSADRETTTP